MDDKIQILLGSEKNITSVNVDTYGKVQLTTDASELTEYTVNDVVNATLVFDEERENNPVYRIYGKIDYLSLLNGLIDDYKVLEDFFTPNYTGDSKNIMNSFEFYLVRPESGKEIVGSDNYVRYFEVIATPSEFELYHAGFSNNVYGEQEYAFSFKKDYDVSTYFDKHGLPITDLYLYAQYNLKENGNNIDETMEYSYWSSYGVFSKRSFSPKTLNIGDRVETATGADFGDLYLYDKENFIETQVSGQTIYVTTQYNDGGSKYLVWKFNPFIPFKLRYLSNELYNANTGNTSYDIVNSIPEYATKLDNDGNYVWREIVPQGYTEPLTGNGVDYPFFNKKRYLFSPVVLSISPDLDDEDNGYNTRTVFNEIGYTQNPSTLDITPLSELDDIGKPCK